MECNKEEAFRAKQIAETRMQKNDFNGALRIAQKAQRLYPELENISQLLAVCEVHCSAQIKVFGNEVDWYAILQVEKSADEVTLKKQFRKFALLLHPDKNKFAGAEAAFKLIGEANRVLSDQATRSLYDMRCRNSMAPQTSHAQKPQAHQPTQSSGPAKHNGTRNKQESMPNVQSRDSDKNRHAFGSNGYQQARLETFWTCCPSCHIRYQYFKNFLDRALRCQSCGTPFMAHELSTQDFGPLSQRGQSTCHPKPSNFVFSKLNARHKGASSSGTDDAKGSAVNSQNGSDIGQTNTETAKAHSFRRSSQQKHHVFAKQNFNGEDDFVSPPKRARTDGTVPVDRGCENPNGNHNSACGESGLVRCPDAEFNDFDKLRSHFAADQFWACYDDDGMPRFYARIKKVLDPGFKLQISWLEALPNSKAELHWSQKKLPVACGYYRIGGTEETSDPLMFSHQIHCLKLPHKSRLANYMVYPAKSEIWAIFKNWDINWSSDPEKNRPYKYDYVEILSGFDEQSGAKVAYLRKVKGFVSLFQRVDAVNAGAEADAFYQVPSVEKYRFSHQIPSFKMTGKEREGVPPGSFELDPAGLDLDELQDSPEKESTQMRFHSARYDNKVKPQPVAGNKAANSGETSGGEKRKVVMGLSSQFLVRKLNPEPGRTWLGRFHLNQAGVANKEQNKDRTNGGGNLNLRKSNTSSSSYTSENTTTKNDPTKSEMGSFDLRRSPRGVNRTNCRSGN